MSDDALAWAEIKVAAVRDDPAARLALRRDLSRADRTRAPTSAVPAGGAVVHALAGAPRSAQCSRRVAVGQRLVAGDERAPAAGRLRSDRPGRWPRWRSVVAVRAAVAGVHRHPGTGSLVSRSRNASIVAGYLEHDGLAEKESAPERFFMNVALVRVLYAHSLVAAPRLALQVARPLARVLGDPRLGMVGAFLSLRRVVPNRYPLTRDVEWYVADEQRLGRLFDYGVIVPRLQRLYEWSAEELGEPCARAGSRRQPDLHVAL